MNYEHFCRIYDGLVEYYKQTPNEFIKAAYFSKLRNAGFDDTGLAKAAMDCLERDAFFPTIDRLVELALGDRIAEQAEADWKWAYYLISGGEEIHGLSEVGQRALKSLGKPRDLGMQSEDFVKNQIKAKFLKAYHQLSLRHGLGQESDLPALQDKIFRRLPNARP
jgi:hypothetical protein